MSSLAILVSAVLVLLCGHTDRETDRITETHDCYTHVTTIGLSNEQKDVANKLLF